jgi:hypothetical protein
LRQLNAQLDPIWTSTHRSAAGDAARSPPTTISGRVRGRSSAQADVAATIMISRKIAGFMIALSPVLAIHIRDIAADA